DACAAWIISSSCCGVRSTVSSKVQTRLNSSAARRRCSSTSRAPWSATVARLPYGLTLTNGRTEMQLGMIGLGRMGANMVHGLERGFCLMIGGETEIVERLDPIFASLAPGVDAAPRTEGKDGDPSPAEQGYLHCGPNGAGHFVKMIHNGIEYGIMAAYAEGLNVLHKANAGT